MQDTRDIVTLNVGKNGLGPTVIQEIASVLKKRKYVRIKFLKSFMDQDRDVSRKDLFQGLAARLEARIVSSTGFVLILHRR